MQAKAFSEVRKHVVNKHINKYIDTMTEPLGQGLKMFNQRLLAEHCLSEDDARALWDEIRQQQQQQSDDTINDMNGRTFEESIASSNKQLDFIGLEIVGISIPNKNNNTCEEEEDDDIDVGGTSSSSSSRKIKKTSNHSKKKKNTIYYSIINRFPDEIAKKCFQSMFTSEEQTYVRLVLEKLIENGPTSRNIVLNYKNLLDENVTATSSNSQSQRLSVLSQRSTNHNNDNEQEIDPTNETGVATKRPPLTLVMVEDVIEKLVAEKWLICGPIDYNNINNRRRSSNSYRIDIGPRGYMELSKVLTEEFGLDIDDLPQQIYHRM